MAVLGDGVYHRYVFESLLDAFLSGCTWQMPSPPPRWRNVVARLVDWDHKSGQLHQHHHLSCESSATLYVLGGQVTGGIRPYEFVIAFHIFHQMVDLMTRSVDVVLNLKGGSNVLDCGVWVCFFNYCFQSKGITFFLVTFFHVFQIFLSKFSRACFSEDLV